MNLEESVIVRISDYARYRPLCGRRQIVFAVIAGAIALLAIWCKTTYVVAYIGEGESLYPYYKVGDKLLVDKRLKPQKGSVVLANTKDGAVAKVVMGVAGEMTDLGLVPTGSFYLTGTEKSQHYILLSNDIVGVVVAHKLAQGTAVPSVVATQVIAQPSQVLTLPGGKQLVCVRRDSVTGEGLGAMIIAGDASRYYKPGMRVFCPLDAWTRTVKKVVVAHGSTVIEVVPGFWPPPGATFWLLAH